MSTYGKTVNDVKRVKDPMKGLPKHGIREIENDVTIVPPKFVVDKVLAKGIPKPLPDKSFFMVLSGPPGSGKSSMLVSLCTAKPPNKVYRGVFDQIILCMPEHSRNSMETDAFQGIDKRKVFDELNDKTIQQIFSQVEKFSKQGEQTLLILDDQASFLKASPMISKTLAHMMNNRRHLRLSCIATLQVFNFLPMVLRKVVTHLVFWKPRHRNELESLQELMNLDKQQMLQLIQYSFRDKHDHMMVVPESGDLYRNFNTLEITTL